MSTNALNLRLPRRVTAYFLLFGLTAVVWLSAGAFYVARSVTQSRSEVACLRWVGRGSARAALHYLKSGQAGLQPLVEDVRVESSAIYCAIASNKGVYVAHSTRELVGQPVAEREEKK